MRVLLISNLFPTRAAPASCSFITERVHAHTVSGNLLTTIAVSPDFDLLTTALRGARRIKELRPADPQYIRSRGRLTFTDFLSLRRYGLSQRAAARVAHSIMEQ